VRVFCRTNLDNYKHEKWPDRFCCRPQVGDFVQSERGARLKIHEITHARNYAPHLGLPVSEEHSDEFHESILVIELNK